MKRREPERVTVIREVLTVEGREQSSNSDLCYSGDSDICYSHKVCFLYLFSLFGCVDYMYVTVFGFLLSEEKEKK